LALYELTRTAITKLDETTFGSQAITERADLQRLLKQHIEVIAPDTLIIAEEFCEWDESKRRIDLLGLDRYANLVVIELKRTEDGGHMELQAIRYAAMVSAMTFSKAVEVYARYLKAMVVPTLRKAPSCNSSTGTRRMTKRLARTSVSCSSQPSFPRRSQLP
jgi:RecB family endonuclease NucS